MVYVKTNNEQIITFPYTIGQFRKDNSDISFPKQIPDSTLAEYGVFNVIVAEIPAHNEATQNISQDQQPVLVNGQWQIGYSVSEKTEGELQAQLDSVATVVRAKRDSLLAETDWSALVDTTLSDEMRAYRQALRDITIQAGFPENVEWPVKP